MIEADGVRFRAIGTSSLPKDAIVSVQVAAQGHRKIHFQVVCPRHRRCLVGQQGIGTQVQDAVFDARWRPVIRLSPTRGRVFTRNELLDHFYEQGEVVVDRVIDVHVGKLRQKIERDPAQPRFIQTVRGFGYRFADVGEE